jgi:hypothetical protein
MARQRVGMILQPGNVWVIERAVPAGERTAAALRTCHLRGWVEIVENAMPAGDLTSDGRIPDGQLFTRAEPMYRLTDSGWGVIHRSQTWVIATFLVALLSLTATLAALWFSRR